jgi:hypothetical protein
LKTSGETMEVRSFRLSATLIKRLDRHAERLMKKTPGLKLTRGDALRILLEDALARAEQEVRDGKA